MPGFGSVAAGLWPAVEPGVSPGSSRYSSVPLPMNAYLALLSRRYFTNSRAFVFVTSFTGTLISFGTVFPAK
jgi:hypothetical protein